jgi:hypothetical protein
MEFLRNGRDVPLFFIIISLSMALPFDASLATGVETDETSFSKVVQSCFRSWVPDGSGRLTPSRINQLIMDHQLKGDEAAAVAAIHLYFRNHKEVSGLSEAELLGADIAGNAEGHAGDLARVRALNGRFQKFSKRLKMTPRALFSDNAPHLEGIRQGPLGDCWIVSAIGAAVHFHPLLLKEMILPRPDGSWTVKFLNGRSVFVNRLTDSQIALSSTTGDQGLWLNVLEQAFGQVREALMPKTRGMPELDAISLGGNACPSITRLTGNACRRFAIRRIHAKAFPPDLARRPELVAQVRNIIRLAVTSKRLICAGTTPSGEFPPGIHRRHYYAVLGYHPESDTVTLWNPLGDNFEPKGAPGLRNGYAEVNGILHVPVHDFTLVFGGLFFEAPRT